MDGQNFQNNPYQQPIPPEGPQKTDPMAIVSLVLGIASIVLGCCVPILGIALGIGGIICSVTSKKKQKSGFATAGLVCSIIGIVLGAIMWIFNAVFLGILASQGYDVSSFFDL